MQNIIFCHFFFTFHFFCAKFPLAFSKNTEQKKTAIDAQIEGELFMHPRKTTRKMTVFWCVMLGTFGAHRFYLQQPYRGLSYLLFSWTLVPTVLSVIDAAFYWQMSDADFEEENAQKLNEQLAA